MKEIKELRELIGVKQPELAKLLEIQVSNYSSIENGYIKPKNLDEIKRKSYIFLDLLNQQRQAQISRILKRPIEIQKKEVDLNSIFELRKALKITQSYMANELNLAQCQYSLLEKGKLKLKKSEFYHQKALEILQSIHQDTL